MKKNLYFWSVFDEQKKKLEEPQLVLLKYMSLIQHISVHGEDLGTACTRGYIKDTTETQFYVSCHTESSIIRTQERRVLASVTSN